MAVEVLLDVEAQGGALSRSPARGLPAGRLSAGAPRRTSGSSPRARSRRRRGGRHPAFRAHHGRWRPGRPPALRARGAARPAGRHALRRVGRSDVAPCRGAGGRDGALRPAGQGDRLAPHLDALDGQLLRQQADPDDGRSPARRDRQPADQHHPAGPPRHLSQAARPDARAGADGGRPHRRLRPRLHGRSVLSDGLGRHARGRVDGPACRAHDQPRRHARLPSMR